MDHIIVVFEKINVLEDTIVDIVQNPLELLSPLLLLDQLLDPVVPEGGLVRDLTRQHQLAQLPKDRKVTPPFSRQLKMQY